MKRKPADISRLKLSELDTRPSKVQRGMLGRVWAPGGKLSDFMNSLPGVLAADHLRDTVNAVIKARKADRPVIMAMGAHVIKVGLSPLIIDAMERGIITGVAFNGAGMIHDVEMAVAGHTSEDVAEALTDGSFGTARQTGEFINKAISQGLSPSLGETVGMALNQAAPPCLDLSVMAAGARLEIPVTIHVSLGADIIHMHPSFDAAATGKASHYDFRLLTGQVAELKGGVYFNVGSAVVLPEVFLKALSVARNLGNTVKDFTTVNLDMLPHYRPMTNVVHRPVLPGGQGFNITGHHEINMPLIFALIREGLES
jgi:hypothetical protein